MTKNSFTKRLKRAFTITELVIVIAVIAVLAAVLVPTFSNVVDNAKESHDKQIVRSINTSLSAYTVENNGKKPADYEELMMILQEYNLTDKANPFLLADKLDQKGAHLVWYPNTNSVVLLKDNDSDYVINFSATEGLGNGVYVIETAAGTQAFGYVLCTDGKYNFVAQLYYDFYVTSGGDINRFNSSFSGTYTPEKIADKAGNQAFANSITAALSNSKFGYSASNEIKDSVINSVQTAGSATIDIGAIAGADATEEVKVQAVRSTLATLASVVNNSENAAKLDGKDIKLTGVEGLTVDMAGVQTTAIGLTYRKDASIKTNESAPSTPNVDFGGLEITGFSIEENAFVSAGAEWQTAADNGYSGPAYCFTYGLFGTIFAAPGETVTISNLTIEGVDMNLNGSTEMIGGTKVATISDNAGIVAGFTQGNVVFENIVVDGKNGSFSAYDAVSGLVGRTYSNKNRVDTVEIKNCVVKNVTINGQRRAAGFIGFASGVNVKISNSTLENVTVNVEREDYSGIYFGAIGDLASVKNLELNGVTLTNVVTNYSWKKTDGSILPAPPAKEGAPAGVGSYYENYKIVGGCYVYHLTNKDAVVTITNCTVNNEALTA